MHWLDDAIQDLAQRDLLRVPLRITATDATHASLGGQLVTVFCANDYLGLRFHPSVVAADRSSFTGAGASRLVSGNDPRHEEAEAALATYVRLEAALVMNSGYAANVGAIPALMQDGDAIFSDAFNHASIVDGCRLSRATVHVFPHADVAALERLIESQRPFRRGWIVTESLFSMDGDVVPLAEYARIARADDLHLYVDEAHAIGVIGPDGRGECARVAITPDVLVGTLGKALGGAGAFIAGTASLRTYLWSRCRTHVFSTGLPPALAAAASSAVRIASTEPRRRERLHANIQRLRSHLRSLARPPLSREDSPIIPIVLGNERVALDVSRALLCDGFFVQAIRPPTVPPGTSRLRVTLSAEHTADEIDSFAASLARHLP